MRLLISPGPVGAGQCQPTRASLQCDLQLPLTYQIAGRPYRLPKSRPHSMRLQVPFSSRGRPVPKQLRITQCVAIPPGPRGRPCAWPRPPNQCDGKLICTTIAVMNVPPDRWRPSIWTATPNSKQLDAARECLWYTKSVVKSLRAAYPKALDQFLINGLSLISGYLALRIVEPRNLLPQ